MSSNTADQPILNEQDFDIEEKLPEFLKEMEVEERIIVLPHDRFTFGQRLKKLYYETLYKRKESLENFITIVDKFIEHLVFLNIPVEDILYEIQKYTLTTADLDLKYQAQVPKAKFSSGAFTASEKEFLESWWKQVLEHPSYNSNEFEKLSLTALRLREAQLQVILYCLICKLLKHEPIKVTEDPNKAAQSFFDKTVIIFMHNNVEDFLLELDAKEDDPTIERDPCDLVDSNFAHVLEEKFKDCLPELVNYFKEATGDEEFKSIPDETDIFAEIAAQEKKKAESRCIKRPLEYSGSTSRFQEKQKSQTNSLMLKKSKHTYINPIIESLMKRTVLMPTKVDTSSRPKMSEATKSAIDRIERTKRDGKPTLKRVGGFIKSALSPKRPKASSTSNDTVTLRKSIKLDHKLSPRTQINRYFNANIFTQHSEHHGSTSTGPVEVELRLDASTLNKRKSKLDELFEDDE